MKIYGLILFSTIFIIGFSSIGCGLISRSTVAQNDNNNNSNQTGWSKPKVLATIKDNEITESSGVAASRRNAGIFWTHNDSGDAAFIYAFDTSGKKRGVWKVAGAKNTDWEDIAAFTSTQDGANYLFLGDIGNNQSTRSEMQIYVVKEPKVDESSVNSSKKNPLSTEKAVTLRVKYPDGNHDAETLLVHPQTNDLYVVTKELTKPAGVYRLRAPFAADKMNTLEKVAEITVPSIPNGLLTGGDIAPDGKHVILVDYFGAYELILPEKAKNFDEIWKEKPSEIKLGDRKQGEGICYSLDGNAVYATSEKKDSPLIEVKRK